MADLNSEGIEALLEIEAIRRRAQSTVDCSSHGGAVPFSSAPNSNLQSGKPLFGSASKNKFAILPSPLSSYMTKGNGKASDAKPTNKKIFNNDIKSAEHYEVERKITLPDLSTDGINLPPMLNMPSAKEVDKEDEPTAATARKATINVALTYGDDSEQEEQKWDVKDRTPTMKHSPTNPNISPLNERSNRKAKRGSVSLFRTAKKTQQQHLGKKLSLA